MAEKELKVKVTIDDQATAALKRLQEKTKEIHPGFKKMAIASGAAFTAIVGGVTLAVNSFSSLASELYDMSVRTGITVQALSELKFAAEMSGISIDVVEGAVRRMNIVLLAADEESKGAQLALERLGVSLENLQGLDVENKFLAIAEKIASIEDPSTKSAAAMAVFGKQGAALLPMLEEAGADMKRLREEAVTLGITMDTATAKAAKEFKDNLDRLKNSIKGVAISIAKEFLPIINRLIIVVKNSIVRIREWIDRHPTLTKYILIAAAALSGFVAVATSLAVVMASGVVPAALGVTAAMIGMLAPFSWLIPVVAGLSYGLLLLAENSELVRRAMIQDFWEITNSVANAVNVMIGLINELIWAINKIPGVEVPLVPKIDTSQIQGALDSAKVNYKAYAVEVSEANKRAKESTESSTKSILGSYSGIGAGAGGAGGKVKDAFDKMKKDVEDYDEKLAESLGRIKESIASLKEKISDLIGDYKEQEKSDREDLAKSIVEQETKIADTKREIEKKKAEVTKAALEADGLNRSNELQAELSELQTTLTQEEEARKQNQNLIKSFDTEVSEARRVSRLTDLERAIENFRTERSEASATFKERLGNIREEMTELKTQKADMLKLVQEREEAIRKLEKESTGAFKLELQARLTEARQSVSAVIAEFDRLAKASSGAGRTTRVTPIKRSEGGVVPGFASGGIVGDSVPAMLTPGELVLNAAQQKNVSEKLSGGITVNISGNTLLDDNAAEKLGDMIVRRLSFHMAV